MIGIRIIVACLIALISIPAMAQETPVEEYKTVTIGGMVWMAENLNREMPGGYCYKNDPVYCKKNGRLYIYGIALKACPAGWHLPTNGEWNKLAEALGGASNAGQKMKEGGDSGFEAKMSGLKKEGGFDYFGINSETGFWTASTANPKQVYIREIKAFSPVLIESLGTIGMGLSVRCVKGSAEGNTEDGSK